MSLGQHTQEFMNESWDPDIPPGSPSASAQQPSIRLDDHTAAQLLAPWDIEAEAPLGPDTCDALNASWDWENEELAVGDETIDLLNESWEDEQIGGAGGALPTFHMTALFEQAVPSLGTVGRAFRVTFENMENLIDVYGFFINVLQEIIDRAFGEANENDLVGMEITHPGLNAPIIVRFRPHHMLNADVIWNTIELVMQSNTEFTLDDQLTIQTVIIANHHGAGPGQYERRKTRYNLDEWIKDKKGAKSSCVIGIDNKDKLCLARAIVTGIARHERILNSEKRKEWNAIRQGDKNRYTRQGKLAQQLMVKAGLGCVTDGCGREHFDALQQAIAPRFRLRVTDAQCMLSVVYCGGTQGDYIDVLLHEGHFDLITSMAAFFGQSTYCDFCKTGYNNRDQHTWCGHRCPCCYAVGPCEKDQFISCSTCHRWFVSQSCFDNHAKVTTYAAASTDDTKRARCETSVCATVQRCEGCGKTLHIGRKNEDKKHECGMTECRFCKDMVDPNEHLCFMQPIEDTSAAAKKKKKKSPTCYIYYDFETSQDEVFGENAEGIVFKHNVNCVNMRKCCDWCDDKPDDTNCLNCVERNKTWVGDSALTDFCKWLFSAKNKDAVALAHNASGFDGQFILDDLHKQAIAPEIITRGLSIISIGAAGNNLLDSMCFIPMALSSMPKAFGIQASKGYFPHLFNSKENWDYEGPLPDAWYYGPGTMKAGARGDFYKWYNAQDKQQPFNLQQELVRYCQMDVEILMRGCMTFRRLLLDQFSVDPFTTSSTIPGTCMHIYRKLFMPLESIGIVPHGGYRKHDKQSIVAIKWLKYISETEGLDIQHALNGGEVRIGRWKVDGQLRGTKQLYEFNGCVYHGCPHCFPNRKNTLPRKGVTVDEAYQSTMDRQQDLERQGYSVRVMWECELNRMLKADKDMASYFKNLPIHDPLEPREAFFGGRTNAIRLYYKVKDGEKIYYMDICSLYPFICKYMPFPVGHPLIITENFQPINKTSQPYQGLIKCRVCPPRRLLHPVLPLKSGHKLVFPLCKPCADDHFQGNCTHSDDERSFWGTWTHVEVYKAVQRGYQVTDIAEVYHWAEWSVYDGKDPSTGLFTTYINACLKLKQQASGWPSWAKTDAQKDDYIRQYMDKEGIQLDWDKIDKNPALRSLAKLMLNSFWGKFGQRCNLSKIEYFTDPSEYYGCVFDACNDVASVRIVNTAMVCATYEKFGEYVEEQNHTNPIIAAYVTAHARLKLLSYLEPLGRNVLYFDTDSVIFVHRSGEYMPPTGDFLGDMTDELDEGSHITEYVSGGPKVYSYKTNTGSGAFKMRGVTIDATTAVKFNHRSLKKQVITFLQSGDRGHVDAVSNRIARNADRTVVTKTMRKKYQVTYDKRRVLKSGFTLPYGY